MRTIKAISPLREVVGDEVYGVWVEMLRKLVPHGRTHRLSVVVAGMLAYASCIASASRDDEDDPAYPLVAPFRGLEDEEAFRLLEPMLARVLRMPRSGTNGSALQHSLGGHCRVLPVVQLPLGMMMADELEPADQEA